jgi:hypothetical protein
MKKIIFPKEKKSNEIEIRHVTRDHKIAIYLDGHCIGFMCYSHYNAFWIHITEVGSMNNASTIKELIDSMLYRDKLKFYVL